MAKAATKTAPDKKKKKPAAGKAGTAKPATRKAKASSAPKSKSKPKPESKSKRSSSFDNFAKLVDHPLLADLLAAGALAAVAVIAEHKFGDKNQSSSKAIKTAGKAAAAAIGKKLLGEFGMVADAASKAAKKA